MKAKGSSKIFIGLALAMTAVATLALPGVFSFSPLRVQAKPVGSISQRSLLDRYSGQLTNQGGKRSDGRKGSVGIQATCTSAPYNVSSESLTEIVPGTDDVGNHGDDLTTGITLPFPYRLYDQTFTTAVVSSNGVLQFLSNNADPENVCLPSAGFDYAIFAHWDNLCTSGDCTDQGPNGGDGYGIFTATFGEAGERVFVIEWRTIYADSSASAEVVTANFEIRLYEGLKKFDIIYGAIGEAGCSATVGVQKDTGSCFTEYLCNPGCQGQESAVSVGRHTGIAALAAQLESGLKLTFEEPSECSLSCPEDIFVSNAPGQCGATVTFSPPTATGNCGPVVCTDTNGVQRNSGDFFPVGTTSLLCSSNDGSCVFHINVTDVEVPSITCPGDISTSTDPNQCSAVVNYPAPQVTDNCPLQPFCDPPAGSAFPTGTTLVTCTVSDSGSNEASCMFNVTVTDTQKPTIICPQNITVVDDSGACVVVNYPDPTISDNCPDSTVMCSPASGTCFPPGTTTVNCTVTDASNNTAKCSFTVGVGNVCLQDDGNPSTVIVFNVSNGEYRFCCGGTVFAGVGRITRRGNTISLDDQMFDRRVLATFDGTSFKGNATIQVAGRIRCTIADRDTRNNSCVCQ